MRKLTKLEKDFRDYISAAIKDKTPLPDQWKSSAYGGDTFGDINKRYIECYERGLATMQETIEIIDRNMLEAEHIRFAEKGENNG